MSEIDTTKKVLLDDDRSVLNPNYEEIDSALPMPPTSARCNSRFSTCTSRSE